MFRKLNCPVIYVQHDGTGTGEFEKYSTEWKVLDDLIVEPTDVLIDKYVNDVFYKTDLQAKLIELKVGELFVTGCATDFCVESTIQSALTKDYHITVVSDGHTTGDRPSLIAEKVVEHYNWVWENMIPTDGTIEVKTFKQIKEEIKQ